MAASTRKGEGYVLPWQQDLIVNAQPTLKDRQ
jgi:hypothetical protein